MNEILNVLDKTNAYSISTVGSKEIDKENICTSILPNTIDPITCDIISIPESGKLKYPKLSVSKYT